MKNREILPKRLVRILQNFAFGAVQRLLNPVDLLLQNAYLESFILDVKIGADTEENDPSKVH